MSRGFGRRAAVVLRLALAGVVLLPALTWAAGSRVTSSVDMHSFVVPGTTATALVRYMNSHALTGDHGHAYANIHPDYQLSLTTRQNGAMCAVSQISVKVAFDETLPVAANPGGMSRSTRAAWNAFAAFARAHEAHHKASYLGCASDFVAKAARETASQCFGLQADIRSMLHDMKQGCEAKQVPFDRSQARILARLSLFAMARY